MDTHFFVDVDRAGNRRRSWPWDQDRNRSRPSVCEDRRSLESLAFQFQIPRIPIWSCRSVDGVFWCSFFASRRIGLVCLPIPIVIGFSRMYVAAHYLSDVVCAAVLGILTALLVAHFLLRPIRNPQSAITN